MSSPDQENTAPIVYAFVVQSEDGQQFEVLVQEDGLAFKRPLAVELLDDTNGFVELRRAS